MRYSHGSRYQNSFRCSAGECTPPFLFLFFLFFLKCFYFKMCMCAHMCACVHVYVCVWRPGEGFGSPGAGVTGSCESPGLGAGNHT